MQKLIDIVKERKFKYICFFWVLISIQFVIGNNLQKKGYSVNGFWDFLISLLKIILFSVIFTIVHYLILKLKNKLSEKVHEMKKKTDTKSRIEKYKGIIYFLIIIICWIPALLAFYPVLLNYDGLVQLRDVAIQQIYTRHPIIHTLLLGVFYKFGYAHLGSCANGMLMFSIFQMTVMASIFSYSVRFVEERTDKKWLRNISLIFYAIFPFNQLFPLMTTKDVLFAGFVLLFIIELYKILENSNNKNLNHIVLVIITVIMLSFRNNAVYAIIASIPFIIMVFKKDSRLLKILLSCVIVIVAYKTLNNGLIYITKATRDSNQEKMSVFSQATAKICKEKSDELTDDEKEKISFYFDDYEELGKVYEANISDKTKAMTNCDNVDNNIVDFLKFMGHLGIKYPRQFVDSFLNTTRGYWYICDNSFNQIHHNEFPETKGCLELTFDEFTEIVLREKENSKWPEVQKFYRKAFCENEYTKIPVLYVIFQPAIYFYIVLGFLLYSIYKREKNEILIGTFLFLYFVTCFLGPVAIIRYIYAVIVSVPVLSSMVLKKKNEREYEKSIDNCTSI